MDAINWALTARTVSSSARHVLLVMANAANGSHRAWLSVAKLSVITGLARRSVQRALRDLESASLIRLAELSKGTLAPVYILAVAEPSTRATVAPASYSHPRHTGAGGAPHSHLGAPNTTARGATVTPNPNDPNEPKNAGAPARVDRAPAQDQSPGNGTLTQTGNSAVRPPSPPRPSRQIRAPLEGQELEDRRASVLAELDRLSSTRKP